MGEFPNFLFCVDPFDAGSDGFLLHTREPFCLIEIERYEEYDPHRMFSYTASNGDIESVDFFLPTASEMSSSVQEDLLHRAQQWYLRYLDLLDKERAKAERRAWQSYYRQLENLQLSTACWLLLMETKRLGIEPGETFLLNTLMLAVDRWPPKERECVSKAFQEAFSASLLLTTERAGLLCLTRLGYAAAHVDRS